MSCIAVVLVDHLHFSKQVVDGAVFGAGVVEVQDLEVIVVYSQSLHLEGVVLSW